jgi:CheY-like chemotaxis protein
MTEQPACVLVVDDDDSIRKMIRALLTRSGYSVCEARNGREALDEMRAGRADLVVLDLMMPEVSGWDVLIARAADADLRRIPVIVASANRGPEIADALRGGICALLPKPFELEALRALVASCLVHPHDDRAMV